MRGLNLCCHLSITVTPRAQLVLRAGGGAGVHRAQEVLPCLKSARRPPRRGSTSIAVPRERPQLRSTRSRQSALSSALEARTIKTRLAIEFERGRVYVARWAGDSRLFSLSWQGRPGVFAHPLSRRKHVARAYKVSSAHRFSLKTEAHVYGVLYPQPVEVRCDQCDERYALLVPATVTGPGEFDQMRQELASAIRRGHPGHHEDVIQV